MFKFKIKFAEVKVGNKALSLMEDCVKNNWVTNGPKVKELEEQFANLMKYRYVVATNSGTTADMLACLSLYSITNAKPGDEIICPALGFIASANSIFASGFKPVFCDIKRETLNIDETKIEKLITKKTKAILAINTMGLPCKMDALRQICDKHNLILICDNCEGHFCRFKGRLMTDWADIVTYSSYSAHLIFSVEMGFIGTNIQDIDEACIANRTHGRPHGNLKFDHDTIGWNAKPTDLHACVGLESLSVVETTLSKRLENLNKLKKCLEIKGFEDLFIMSPHASISPNDFISVCPHALSLTLKNDNEKLFNKFFTFLEKHGIEPKLNFRCIPTQQKCYSYLGYELGSFPEAEFVGRNGLHLPVHQFLTDDDIAYMVNIIEMFFNYEYTK